MMTYNDVNISFDFIDGNLKATVVWTGKWDIISITNNETRGEIIEAFSSDKTILEIGENTQRQTK